MGCFDELRVRCPKCRGPVDFQSKAGGCRMARYNSRNVPPAIAGDLNGSTEACDACGYIVQIHVQTIVSVGEPEPEDEDVWDD